MSLEEENVALVLQVARMKVLLAEYRLAVLKFNSIEESEVLEAVGLLEKCAKQGHTMAVYYLALAYFFGKGMPVDHLSAFNLFQQISEKSFQACHMLGVCYEEGKGTNINYEFAFACYHKSAEVNHVPSIFNVGLCYENGIGTRRNVSRSIQYYTKAAEQNHIGAMYNLSLLYLSNPNQEKLGIHWLTKAAELGLVNAQYTLGCCYKNGEGVTSDINIAVKYFKKGSKQNHISSINALANQYFSGFGVPVTRNVYKALKLYQRSVQLNHSRSLSSVNLCMKVLHMQSPSVSNSSSSSSAI